MKSPSVPRKPCFLCRGKISNIFWGTHVASSQTKRLPHSFRKSDTCFYPKNVSACQKVRVWAPEATGLCTSSFRTLFDISEMVRLHKVQTGPPRFRLIQPLCTGPRLDIVTMRCPAYNISVPCSPGCFWYDLYVNLSACSMAG